MTVIVEFSDELEARLGTRSTYLHVEDGETVHSLVERMTDEFDASVPDYLLTDERLRRGSVVRRSAVASEPLSPNSRISSATSTRPRASSRS